MDEVGEHGCRIIVGVGLKFSFSDVAYQCHHIIFVELSLVVEVGPFQVFAVCYFHGRRAIGNEIVHLAVRGITAYLRHDSPNIDIIGGIFQRQGFAHGVRTVCSTAACQSLNACAEEEEEHPTPEF